MSKITLQELFTKGVQGFRAQGYIRSENAGQCLYRGPSQTKCFVGHLIPDDKYHPIWDSPSHDGGFSRCFDNFADFRDLWAFDDEVSTEIAGSFQSLHDTGTVYDTYAPEARAAAYEANFKRFAAKYGLTYPEIEQ